MGKYNLCATKEDWENLYKEVEALGFDAKWRNLKHFKKSQSFDSALVQLDIMKDKEGENKMTEEFNLSDKIERRWRSHNKGMMRDPAHRLSIEDVKEFIKELKEINQKFWDMGHFNPKTMDEQIDKLAGDELK
jgi:hypothetical protein|tara:strand:- start:579 stop:977 length:399 start_codon:yes stop_codon:yes gene_type:complete